MDSAQTSPSAQAVAMQTLSVISILISFPPLALHWKNRNFPATSLICWCQVLTIFNIANAFIWPTDDIQNWWDGAGLCDIEVKILIGSYVAVPGTLLCIFRSLAYVLDTRRATLVPTKRQRWQNRIVELLFCALIPLVAAILHLIYQGNRYFIFAISGCVTSVDQSWVSLALGYIWPLVVCFIATYYCGLTLYRVQRYRNQFSEIIRSANSGLSRSRFIRLFSLSFIMLLALIPIQTYMVYRTISLSLPWHPYSWSSLHEPTWSEIVMVPTNGEVYFDRWIPVAAGFMSFIFFGCGRDASRMYRSLLQWVGLGCCLGPVPMTTSSTGSLPPNITTSVGSGAQLIAPGARHARNDPYHSSTTTTTASQDLEKGRTTQNTTTPPKLHWLKRHIPFPSPLPHLTWSNHFPFITRRPPSPSRFPSTPHLAIPTTTVCTSAWAGSSQSRSSIDLDLDVPASNRDTDTDPTRDRDLVLDPGVGISPDSTMSGGVPWRTDFIRVKRVIRQEREVQV
ncbi:pheromone receptor [Aspergillus lucknowensis]|uniref:Pheromone A receptor-domain-containing protein n=1 Tax=Aspergillus lucknowensis TaxID=176173 RepID=A0ABR4L9A3_9EURO